MCETSPLHMAYIQVRALFNCIEKSVADKAAAGGHKRPKTSVITLQVPLRDTSVRDTSATYDISIYATRHLCYT